MTKASKTDFLNAFKTPTGIAVGMNIILLIGNFIFASQLLPVTSTIALLAQRVDTLEQKVSGQESIIIPRGELDAKFININTQLGDIKDAINAAKLR